MPDIGGLVGSPLGVGQDRQVACDARGIHIVEKDRAVAAQQVLHVVLGGRKQQINTWLLHQAIEAAGVERGGGTGGRLGDVEHGVSSVGGYLGTKHTSLAGASKGRKRRRRRLGGGSASAAPDLPAQGGRCISWRPGGHGWGGVPPALDPPGQGQGRAKRR